MPDAEWLDDPVSRSRSLHALPTPPDDSRPSQPTANGRPAVCPECGAILAEQDQPAHLIAEHGYVALAGSLLPRNAALRCLWDRVFRAGDPRAQARLHDLLQNQPALNSDRDPYMAALETELRGHLKATSGNRRRDLERLVRNLRKSATARVNYWDLLTSSDPHVRQLGREVVLPEVGQALAATKTSAAEVRRWLDRLCPADDVWSKIFVCQRLPHFGADTAAVKDCLRQLQEERPVACPECSAPVPHSRLATHLRQIHHIHQFRGVQRSLAETLATLLPLVCSPQPDHEAWEALEAIAREEHGPGADVFLATHVSLTLAALPETVRDEALAAVADLLAVSESGPNLALLLATSSERVARHLALLLTPRLTPPLGRLLVRAIRKLLGRRRAPTELQFAAAEVLFKTTSTKGPRALKTLNALIARCSKARAVERLRQLEQQIGPTPLVTERCFEIENSIRMVCPRCRAQLQRPEMARHLWSEHQLLLDGRHVRQPWHLVRDWLKEYRRDGNAELLARCRTLAQYIDPQNGLRQVHRLTLACGIEDVEARQVLLAEARRRRAALCPHCYALVAVPVAVTARPLNQSHGRLSLEGYCMEVSEGGLVARLRLEIPGKVLTDTPEPGRWLTRKGAMLLAVGPLVGAAIALALALPAWDIQPRWPVALCVGLAFVAYVSVWYLGRKQPAPVERAVDYAWDLLVPRLHANDYSPADGAFLAGLALTSIDHGQPEARADRLAEIIQITEDALANGTAEVAHLAALRRLEAADADATARDPVPVVAAAVGRCLAGELPLTFAQQLLADWEGSWWTTGNLARLRVLLCDQAFEAGYEVRDLLDAGRAAPALADVLQTVNPDGLAELRLLWSQRPHRPWDRCGEAITVFELVNDAEAGRRLLGKYPDLLLAEVNLPVLFVCGRGVVFQDVLFQDYPRKVETRHRRAEERADYEVILDEYRFTFASDPTAVVKRLERWFRYFLNDFLPLVEGVHSWKAPSGTKPLLFQKPVVCPECQQLLVPRAGDVGTALSGTNRR
jgi:hypothetical protein